MKKAKPADLPMKYRIVRKATPNGCDEAWWYANKNGSVSVYVRRHGGPTLYCIIPARMLNRVFLTAARAGKKAKP